MYLNNNLGDFSRDGWYKLCVFVILWVLYWLNCVEIDDVLLNSFNYYWFFIGLSISVWLALDKFKLIKEIESILSLLCNFYWSISFIIRFRSCSFFSIIRVFLFEIKLLIWIMIWYNYYSLSQNIIYKINVFFLLFVYFYYS